MNQQTSINLNRQVVAHIWDPAVGAWAASRFKRSVLHAALKFAVLGRKTQRQIKIVA